MSRHLETTVWEIALGGLDGDALREAQHHLADCAGCRVDLDAAIETLGSLPLALAPVAPPASSLDRLLAAIASPRFARFVAQVADLLDVTRRRARELLDGIDVATSWGGAGIPGISLYHLVGGPRTTGAVVGFIRVEKGQIFPPHEHYGDESALCIQGHLVDSSGRVYGPGETSKMPKGSEHWFRAGDDGDLIYCVVVFEGVKIGDVVYRSNDPGL